MYLPPSRRRTTGNRSMPIRIDKVNDTTFNVTVSGRTTTTHTVTVTPEYYDKLTGGAVLAETLIEKSFEFLLEREPNTSILRTFDLTVIQRYFPEYEKTIHQRLA
jgi:hypothetical protein